MIIDCKELHGIHKNTILAHALLYPGGSKDNNLIQQVLKTLEDKDERVIDVKVLFNNVEYDGQILENLLQEQWLRITTQLTKKYENTDKLVKEEANKLLAKQVSDQTRPYYTKLQSIRNSLDSIEISLDCLKDVMES